MIRLVVGRLLIGAALLSAGGTGQAGAEREVALDIRSDDGALVARVAAPEFCLHWFHSVTGGAVADCFEIREGQLVLLRSYLHDFAAGLGHLPGRGVQVAADGGGYWIEGIDAPVPGNRLPLRVGSTKVGHRIVAKGAEIDLSAMAAGQRVFLGPVPQPAE